MTTEIESKLQQRVNDLESRVAGLEGRLQLALMDVWALPANAPQASSPARPSTVRDQEIEFAAGQAKQEMYLKK